MGLSGLFKKRDIDINAAMRDANDALESLLSDWVQDDRQLEFSY